MNYKSIETYGVKGVGRVEVVQRDNFTEKSVGKNIVIDGSNYLVKSIYDKEIKTIRLNVTTEQQENLKNK